MASCSSPPPASSTGIGSIQLTPQLLNPPRGRNGQRVFHSGFSYVNKDLLEPRTLYVGEFVFVRVTPSEDPCIAELQLCWSDETANSSLASLRLYFLPEQTDGGRQSSHGQHELLVASDSVVLRLDDLVGWITEEVEWSHGLVVDGGVTLSSSSINTINASPASNCSTRSQSPSLGEQQQQKLAQIIDDVKKEIKQEAVSQQRNGETPLVQEDNKENLLAANSPTPSPSREKDKETKIEENGVSPFSQQNGQEANASCPHVLVLSYPRYCRFRAMLRRMENENYAKWSNHPLVEALGGISMPKKGKYHIHFAREEFEHEGLTQNEQLCEYLGPSLKSRFKKKGCFGKRARSPGSDSNASEEGRDNIRIQLENRMMKTSTNEVCRKQEDFLRKLFQFMKERRTPISRIPMLGFKQIDLYDFYNLCQELGGYEAITFRKLWKKIYDTLGGHANNTSAATYTRRHYERLLLPYERYMREQEDEKTKKKRLKQQQQLIAALTGDPNATINGSDSNGSSAGSETANGAKDASLSQQQLLNGSQIKDEHKDAKRSLDQRTAHLDETQKQQLEQLEHIRLQLQRQLEQQQQQQMLQQLRSLEQLKNNPLALLMVAGAQAQAQAQAAQVAAQAAQAQQLQQAANEAGDSKSVDVLVKKRMAELMKKEDEKDRDKLERERERMLKELIEPPHKKVKQERDLASASPVGSTPQRPNRPVSSSPRPSASPHTASPPTQLMPNSLAGSSASGPTPPLCPSPFTNSSQQRSGAPSPAASASSKESRRLEEEMANAWRQQIAALCTAAAANNTKAQQELMARLMEQIYTNGPYAGAAASMWSALTGKPLQLPNAISQLSQLGRNSTGSSSKEAARKDSSRGGKQDSRASSSPSPKLNFQPHRMSPGLTPPNGRLTTPPPSKPSGSQQKYLGSPSLGARPDSAGRRTPVGAHRSSTPKGSGMEGCDALDLSVKKSSNSSPAKTVNESLSRQAMQGGGEANGLLDLSSATKKSLAAHAAMSSQLGLSISNFINSSPLQRPSSTSSSSSHSKQSSHAAQLSSLNASLQNRSQSNQSQRSLPSPSGSSSSRSSSKSSPAQQLAKLAHLGPMASLLQQASAGQLGGLTITPTNPSSSSSSRSKSSSSSSSSAQAIPIPASTKSSNGKLPKIPQLVSSLQEHGSSKSGQSSGQGSSSGSSKSKSSSGVPSVSDYNPTLPAFIPQSLYPGLSGLAGVSGMHSLPPGLNPMMAALMRQGGIAALSASAAAQTQQNAAQQAASLRQQQQAQAGAAAELMAYKELMERGMMLPPGMGMPSGVNSNAAAAAAASGQLMQQYQQYLQMMYGAGHLQPPK